MLEQNKLYSVLKKLSVKLESEGYYLNTAYTPFHLSKNESFSTTLGFQRVTLYMHTVWSSNYKNITLSFSADISSLLGGTNYYTVEQSLEVVKYWNRILNLCISLNSMNICGRSADFIPTLNQILSRKHKDL